jgi:hypothetical protein
VFRPATRHLLFYRVGIIKQRWDDAYGINGEIRTEIVHPSEILVPDAIWRTVVGILCINSLRHSCRRDG